MNSDFDNTKKLAEKIDRNSFWETYVPNIFYLYSIEKAKEVTDTGKKALSEMMKRWTTGILFP